jgi:PAS domain S-box-containing protein
MESSSAPAPALAQEALRISEQSYRLLIEDAPYAICRATETGQLLQINRAMLEMLGYPPCSEADLLIRDLPLIFAADDGFAEFRHNLLHRNTVQGLESAWLRRDGRRIQVRIGGRRVRGPAGETFYFELLAENITERKELEARLAQAEKMQAIGQLAGGIAHDFNNLLTVINGYCDLLLSDETGGRHNSLEIIRRAGERAAALTQQLLAFSRKQVTRTETVHVNAIVAEVLQLSRRLIGENIEVAEDLCPDCDTVLADAAQIHQMLMNLVINARDAMPEGGRLGIATSAAEIAEEAAAKLEIPAGSYVELEVRDSGIGMDESVRGHLFEPFFTTKPTGKGTGLGLATVYGIVRQSRGGISVESRPGEGSRFRVYLPRFVTPVASGAPAEAPRAIMRGTSTILVAEDEEALRRLITELLTAAGYEVLAAADAQQAVAIAEKRGKPIDLLLTDMVMPGLSGRKLAEVLRSMHPESKVLLMSGYSASLSSPNQIGPGIGYLPKPFTPEQLTRTVSEALARKLP